MHRRLPGEPDHILAIGEAKNTATPVGDGDLARLEHLRGLLPSERIATPPRLLLFSRSGFTRELRATVASRADVRLIDLDHLYHGD